VIELRCTDYNQDIHEYSDYFDEFSIGTETCFHKMPKPNELIKFVKNLNEIGKKTTIVTPKVPESQVDKFINYLKKVYKYIVNCEIVVNDFGVLEIVSSELGMANDIVIGRGIARTMVDCPWYEHIIRSESISTKRNILQNNMHDNFKKKLLDEYNVKGIECNWNKNQIESYANLKKLGYKVKTSADFNIIAFSRVCQIAKYFDIKHPNCTRYCNEVLEIEMKKIWSRRKDLEVFKNDSCKDIKGCEQKFYLIDNTLRTRTDKILKVDMNYIDTIIFEQRSLNSYINYEYIKKLR
jgi:hypothetical protein